MSSACLINRDSLGIDDRNFGFYTLDPSLETQVPTNIPPLSKPSLHTYEFWAFLVVTPLEKKLGKFSIFSH